MSTLNNQLYIDGVVVKGIGRTFSVSIKQPTEETATLTKPEWEPLDLSSYTIQFDILGSADGNGIVLVRKTINQISDETTEGLIREPATGEFTFVITADDTNTLGLGSYPIVIKLLDSSSGTLIHTLTEGGTKQGEFSKITVVRA